jgi:hypothetical protein
MISRGSLDDLEKRKFVTLQELELRRLLSPSQYPVPVPTELSRLLNKPRINGILIKEPFTLQYWIDKHRAGRADERGILSLEDGIQGIVIMQLSRFILIHAAICVSLHFPLLSTCKCTAYFSGEWRNRRKTKLDTNPCPCRDSNLERLEYKTQEFAVTWSLFTLVHCISLFSLFRKKIK